MSATRGDSQVAEGARRTRPWVLSAPCAGSIVRAGVRGEVAAIAGGRRAMRRLSLTTFLVFHSMKLSHRAISSHSPRRFSSTRISDPNGPESSNSVLGVPVQNTSDAQ